SPGLVPGSTYRVDATIAGANGIVVHASSTFTTMTPSGPQVSASIFPDNGLTVGVAQPVVIHFDHFITDANARASVLARFKVQESVPVAGGWHWFSNKEL